MADVKITIKIIIIVKIVIKNNKNKKNHTTFIVEADTYGHHTVVTAEPRCQESNLALALEKVKTGCLEELLCRSVEHRETSWKINWKIMRCSKKKWRPLEVIFSIDDWASVSIGCSEGRSAAKAWQKGHCDPFILGG